LRGGGWGGVLVPHNIGKCCMLKIRDILLMKMKNKNIEIALFRLARKLYKIRTYAKYLLNPHFSVTSVPGVVRYSMNLA